MVETETETFVLGLMESRQKLRLLFCVSWNRDRDQNFNFIFRIIKIETKTFILGLIEGDQDYNFYFESNEVDTGTENHISVKSTVFLQA